MSGFTASGTSLTQTSATQLAPLGFVMTVGDGDNGLVEYMYCYNDSGSEIAANIVVQRKDATVKAHILIAPVAGSIKLEQVLGITQTAIPSTHYGWVARKGIVTATADATVNADLPVVMDASTAGNVTHGSTSATAVTGFGATLAGRTGTGTLSIIIDCRG